MDILRKLQIWLEALEQTNSHPYYEFHLAQVNEIEELKTRINKLENGK